MSEEKTPGDKPSAKTASTVVFVLSLLVLVVSVCSFMLGLLVFLPVGVGLPEAAPLVIQDGLVSAVRLLTIAMPFASLLLILVALVIARDRLRWALLALVSNIVLIAIIILIGPLISRDGISLNSQFRDDQADYEAVVELVKQGDIQVPSYTYDLVSLPAGYEQLSSNGSILVDTRNDVTRILFYTQTTLLTYEGYLYISDDQTPVLDFAGNTWFEVRRVAPYWFHVSGKGGIDEHVSDHRPG